MVPLKSRTLGLLAALAFAALPVATATADTVVTLPGVDAAGPAKYDKVKVVKTGPSRAKNVLVLVPGTSAGGPYFTPLAEALVDRLPGWQVWAVERRENLLEDHSLLDAAKRKQAGSKTVFDYYLGWISGGVPQHFEPRKTEDVAFARRWGMDVAIGDLRRVVRSARRGGRKVVLGGHSLGGNIAATYATWDFGGRAGARDLEGLVLIDGGSGPGSAARPTPTPAKARSELAKLNKESPFLDLSGTGLPWTMGVLNALGSTAVLQDPLTPSIGQEWPLLPAALKPPVRANHRAQYGFALDTETGPESLALVQMHLGDLAEAGDPRDWKDGELVTVERAARVFSGRIGMDGTAWYHPRRLTLDGSVTNGGTPTAAQKTLGVLSTRARDADLPIYAFETSLGNGRVIRGARRLARLGGGRLTAVDRSSTYAHMDPIAAEPDKNEFVRTVVPFLRRIR
jgi:pimeloyl-ACP methyl ester carboxylesterase